VTASKRAPGNLGSHSSALSDLVLLAGHVSSDIPHYVPLESGPEVQLGDPSERLPDAKVTSGGVVVAFLKHALTLFSRHAELPRVGYPYVCGIVNICS